MNRVRSGQATVVIAALLFGSPALAHETARAGNVGGLLHLEPDDEVHAARPALAWMEVNLKGGTPITLANCTCTLSAYPGKPMGMTMGKALTARLKPGTVGESRGKLSGTFVFPRAGDWTVVLQGKPRGGAAFKAFRLEWSETILGAGR